MPVTVLVTYDFLVPHVPVPGSPTGLAAKRRIHGVRYRFAAAVSVSAGYRVGSMPTRPCPHRASRELGRLMADAKAQVRVPALAHDPTRTERIERRAEFLEQFSANVGVRTGSAD